MRPAVRHNSTERVKYLLHRGSSVEVAGEDPDQDLIVEVRDGSREMHTVAVPQSLAVPVAEVVGAAVLNRPLLPRGRILLRAGAFWRDVHVPGLESGLDLACDPFAVRQFCGEVVIYAAEELHKPRKHVGVGTVEVVEAEVVCEQQLRESPF